MFFPAFLSLGLVLANVAAAQKVIDVQVGDSTGATVFSPEAVFANPGDQVVFHFQQKNHTATQSSFANPCGQKDGGFNSGFMPVPANQTSNFPTFTVTVNDTTPVWVFCDQAANTAASHCGKGMVFAINCPSSGTNSFTNFKNSALAIGAQLQAQASASSAGAPAASTPAAAAAWTTADYGTATIPAAPTESVVTATVSVEASQWTTVYSSYPGSPAATPASLAGTVHKVIVGGSNGELTYNPSNISAAPRDIIMFEFHQKNHTVTQSSFAAPCKKLADATTGNLIGFDSGFMAVPANASAFPTWNVTVNDTAPIWVYCRQQKPNNTGSHCGSGMVFSVNAVETSARNFSAFQNLAITLNGTNSTGASTGSNPTPSSGGQKGGAVGLSRSTSWAMGLGSAAAIVAALL